MTRSSRWRRAQKYELEFWQRRAARLLDYGGIHHRDLGFVLGVDLEGKRVLEVGCGPMGVIYIVPGALRVGVDPLCREYRATLDYSPRGVHLIASMGEHLPFAADSFDVVIVVNVLDHVDEPGRALGEIGRVLRPGGFAVLAMHVIPRWLAPFRRILNFIDGGHPHHMTEAEACRIVAGSRFELVHRETAPVGLGWRAGWKAALANLAMRNLLLKGRPAITEADPP